MNAVILYDAREWASQAHALLQRASDRVGALTQWQVKPWRVDLLEAPCWAEAALEEAAEAHLMVLAVRDQAALPAGVLRWLERWAEQRRVADAALAVFEEGAPDALSASATPELSAFAQRHGLSFIFGDVTPVEEEPAALLNGRPRPAGVAPYLVAQPSRANASHWGINE